MSLTHTTSSHITLGTVTSADGTSIGYRQLGSGPAVVVVSGAMISSKSHLGLASALSDSFTVYLPDRRGRGLSGPYGPHHCMDREIDDIEALVEHTGASRIYGVSVGALACLHAATRRADLEKLVLYEPAFVSDTSRPSFSALRLDRELARGEIAAALVTGMYEAHLAPPIVKAIPRFLMERLTTLAMKAEERKAGPDDVTMRALAPTLSRDFALINEVAGRSDVFRTIDADVLLVGGSKSDSFFATAIDELRRVLPHASCIEMPGLDHGGSTDRDGKPLMVAEAIRPFLI